MPERPAVDVVIPVAAPAPAVRALVARLRRLALGPGDSLTVVDNRDVGAGEPEVLVAAQVPTSYFARNRGAERGAAPWLLFLDADVDAPPDLLDRLFDPAPAEQTAILAGAVLDEAPGDGAPPAARWAALKASMSQPIAEAYGRWAFAQTANCAVRRAAFEALGGFRDDVRSGGDADLCWRLRAAGWELEGRPAAAVVHRSRRSIRALLRQQARHGAGAGWLAREYPGAFPRRRLPGLAWWSARRAGGGMVALARGDRDAAVVGLLDGPTVWAFELGRLRSNRPKALRQRR